MRVKSELQPGQAARGDKLTISEVLAEYVRAERGRLAPKTYAQYTEVIALFTQSLNGYAANSLSRFERARFDKLFNAEGISIASSAIFSAPSICPQGWHCKRRANRKTFLPCGPDLRDDDWSPGVASLGEYACMQRYLWPKCLGNAQ
jgi:hypothetical protein